MLYCHRSKANYETGILTSLGAITMSLRSCHPRSFLSIMEIIATLLLLAACGPIPGTEEMPSPPIPPTPSSRVPSPSPIPVSASRTPAPTRKLTPTQTPAPTLSAAERATDEAFNAVQTDVALWNTLLATEEAIFPECGSASQRSYSPDGRWVALECIHDLTGVYNLHDSSIAWQMGYYEAFGQEYGDGSHSGNFRPLHWTADGRFLYLAARPCCREGGCAFYPTGLAVFRLELATGEITLVLPPDEQLRDYNVTFSPDDTSMAYFGTWLDHPVLNLRNLLTGKEQSIPLGEQYSDAGYVAWSPDGGKIIFSARTGEECEGLVYFLVMMDLGDFSQAVLLEGPTANYRPMEWVENDSVILELGFEEEYFAIELISHKVTPYLLPSPTPRP